MVEDKEKLAETGSDDGRDSAYAASMAIDELTPEVAALLKSLVSNPHAIKDSLLLMANRLVMGSPN